MFCIFFLIKYFGVIKVQTYKIYHLKDETKELLKYYPDLQDTILSIKPTNNFFSKQIETFFHLNDHINDFFKEYFKHRSNYQNRLNVHIIHNELTKESIIAHVYDYYIEIEASHKKNIFYDILYQKNKNYVILDK